MESNEHMEVLTRAIERLLAEKGKREASGDTFIEDDDNQLLLSCLISRMESLKTKIKIYATTKEEENENVSLDSSPKPNSQSHLEERIEEIAKDIKKVRKQNKVTHILMSVMIILTLTWQLSEYSMIFMLKDRICHPVRSIGNLLSRIFKCKLRPLKKQLVGTSTSQNQNYHNNGNGTNTGSQLRSSCRAGRDRRTSLSWSLQRSDPKRLRILDSKGLIKDLCIKGRPTPVVLKPPTPARFIEESAVEKNGLRKIERRLRLCRNFRAAPLVIL